MAFQKTVVEIIKHGQPAVYRGHDVVVDSATITDLYHFEGPPSGDAPIVKYGVRGLTDEGVPIYESVREDELSEPA